jgi:ribonuclease J
LHDARALELIPLGGLGEFGMNLMVYRHGEDCLVVDAGMMFPGAEHLGVDVVIPNMEFLDSCGTIHGAVLTHGHEDHIGALPFLLDRHPVPAYSTPFTLGLLRRKLAERTQAHTSLLRRLPAPGQPLALGPFLVDTVPVAHSIPHSVMLVVRTPVGTVLHTADFKLAAGPLDGAGTDLRRLARLAEEGVLALLSDSTNADRPGFTPGEGAVRPAFDALVSAARRRVFVTTFASHIHRIQAVADLGVEHGRKVALVGSSMLQNSEVAEDLGLLLFPAGSRVEAEDAMSLPPERALLLVTGSQGEPTSALARIAVDKHRDAFLSEGDLVVHSARAIPGNEKSIGRMFNHLHRRGAAVVTEADAKVHVSGHPASEELRLLLHLVRPRFLVPIHGEYRQLDAHARIGRDAGIPRANVVLADTGDVIRLTPDSCAVVDRVPVGQVFIDASLSEVDLSVLRERKQLAGDGIVVTIVAVDRESGAVRGTPEVVTRGFVPELEDESLLPDAARAVAEAVREATPEERSDEGLLKARVHDELKRFLRRRTQRRPLIIPIVVEL